MVSRALTIAVVIPTWQRGFWLDRCLAGVAVQERLPDEVLIVGRREDESAQVVFRHWLKKAMFPIVWEIVDKPGHMPPIKRGIDGAKADIVAFIDDDAEPLPDWLGRLARHYSSDSVGGVGGRCINMQGDQEVYYPVAEEVGRFHWIGRVVGNMYRDTRDNTPRGVDFFMGGNMSYRRSLLQKIEMDFILNEDVAFNYEVDIGLQVKNLGYALIYEPSAKVRHFSAPRATGGMRTRGRDGIYWYSHNLLYITLKHTKGWRRVAALAYGFLVGDRTGWGLGSAVFESFRGRFAWRLEIAQALHGKLLAIRNVWVASRRAAVWNLP